MGLYFIPVTRDNFDMVLGQPTYRRKDIQARI
jgi:hypothetical protein